MPTPRHIPELKHLQFRPTLFADSARGGYLQHWRNEDYGITVVAKRKDRDHDVEHVIKVDGLVGEFDCVSDVNAAIDAQAKASASGGR